MSTFACITYTWLHIRDIFTVEINNLGNKIQSDLFKHVQNTVVLIHVVPIV